MLKNEEKEVHDISAQDAKLALEKERKERIVRVGKQIGEILKKENCSLEPVITITRGNINTRIEIVALE